MIEKFSEKSRQGQCRKRTADDSSPGQSQTTRKDEPEEVGGAGAKGHAKAQFTLVLRDRVRHHSVKSHGGKKKRQPAQNRNQGDSDQLRRWW